MKIFLDANVLVSVLNSEYPVFTYSSRVLSLTDNRKFEVYTSPICLAIAFYFSEKKSGNTMARKKIALLSDKIKIASTTANAVKKASQNKKIHDFEDGMQYYSALEARCECIITEDKNDFYFSEIDVMNCETFLHTHF